VSNPARAPRSGPALIALAPAAGVVLLALPWISGRMRIGGDIETFLLPVRAFYSECLARGALALWDPHLFCGFPLHAEGQTGVLHPVHLLLYGALPVHWALQAEHLLVIALAFAGAHRMARSLGLSATAAVFAGSAFSFSSFSLAHYVHLPLVAVYAHTPWLCAGAHRLGLATGRRAGAGAAAALAAGLSSQLLLGSPPATVLSGMTWIVFLLAGLAGRRTGGGRRAAAGLAAAAVIVAAAVGAAQWMPTLSFLPATERGHASVDFSGSYSLHPWNLLQFVAPYAFRGLSLADPVAGANRVELSIYPGLGLLLLACAAFPAGRRADAPGSALPVRWLAAGAAVASLLMLGRYGGLAGLLAHVPVLSGFRSPVRHVAIVQFLLLALALEGIRRAEGDAAARSRLRRACAAAAVLVVAAHAAAWPLGWVPGAADAPAVPASAAAALALCGLGAWAGAARPRAIALPAFLLAVCLDLTAFGWAGPGAVPLREIATIERDLAERGSAPTLTRVIAAANGEVLRGFRNAVGYAALEPRLPARFDMAGFSVARIQDARTAAWRDVPGVLPRIRILADAPSRMDIVRDDPLEQEIATGCDASHVLVVGDRHDPDWTCTVDGRPATVEPYLGALRAVPLPPGDHVVRFRYRPRSVRVGLAVSAAGLLGLLALAGVALAGQSSSSGRS
jgi:hypothetical protein